MHGLGLLWLLLVVATISSNTQLATKTQFMCFNSYLAPYHTARCPPFIHSMLWPEINVTQNVSKVLKSTYAICLQIDNATATVKQW